MPPLNDALLEVLKAGTRELREVDVGSAVQRVHIRHLSPLDFATQFVARNKPCIIEGALDAWPALHLWDEEYVTSKAGQNPVSVDLAEGGRADAVHNIDLTTCVQPPEQPQQQQQQQQRDCAEHSGCVGSELQGSTKCFVTPCERKMLLSEFFQLLRSTRHSKTRVVPYVQHQNSSLSEEFSFLLADLQPPLSWADQVFGCKPEAINLWIGDERSVTSFHKDNYENLYGVIRGTKVFHLLPPSDVYRFSLRRYPAAQWECCDSEEAAQPPCSSEEEACMHRLGVPPRLRAKLQGPGSHVTWTEVDPDSGDTPEAKRSFPLFFGDDLPEPLTAEVGPGDLLYLPACWFHRVSQKCTDASEGHDYVMAVNFWYDMAFSHAPWVHLQQVEGLTELLGLLQRA